jgi:sugar phosphate isomerase/epimerase
MGNLIALSLAGLKTKAEIVEYIAGFEAKTGRKALVELPFTMGRDSLDSLRPVLRGRTVSVHATCPSTEFFPNLASEDAGVIERSNRDLDATLETAAELGASVIVVHPGYATNRAIPADEALRMRLLTSDEFKPYIRVQEGSICGPDYADTTQNRVFMERTLANLAPFSIRCAERGIGLAVENLNPRVGYLIQTPRDVIETVQVLPSAGLCLDIGHLWIADAVYGFGFLEGVKRILATGRVLTAHLHSNYSANSGAGRPRYTDDHESLDVGNVPVREALRLLSGSGVNLVIEAKKEALKNGIYLHTLLVEEHFQTVSDRYSSRS